MAIYLTCTSLGLFVLFSFLHLISLAKAKQANIKSRLLFGVLPREDAKKNANFSRRLVLSLLGIIGLLAMRRTLYTLQERLDAAGNPWGVTARELNGAKTLTGLGTAILTGYLLYVLGSPALALMMALTIFLLFNVLPSFMLARMVTARKTSIEMRLADFIDILTVSVESGLGFDAALAKTVEKFRGPVSEEFTIALKEMRLGIARRSALSNICRRNPEIKNLKSVIVAITQAEQFGIGLANVLRIQSEQLRVAKRQQVEEAVQKLPVKIIFPLVFLVLPALFTIILGPAIIKIISMGVV